MQIPNPRIESRILGYLVSHPPATFQIFPIYPRKILEICDPSLLKEEDVNHSDELVALLVDMELRGLVDTAGTENYSLADNGYLQFKRSLAEFEQIDEKKKLFEKIVDSGKAKKEVKKAVKKTLDSFKGKTGEEIVNIILSFIKNNPANLNELLRIIDELSKIGN